MEYELTEAPKTSNTNNLAVAEEGNVDEAVSAEAKASKIWKLILKKNERQNHIKRQ